MNKSIIIAIAASSALSFNAFAGTVAVGVSSATQEAEVAGMSAETTDSGIYLGYRSSEMFGLESLDAGIDWNNATAEGNVVTAFFQPHMDISSDSTVFARVGASITGAAGASSASVAYAIGATYDVTKKYAVEASYNNLYSDDTWDMTSLNLGVTYTY